MANNDWVDRAEYPFAAHYFELPAGRMHYVDEGAGRPVVMVHGTPSWSFLYRHLIRGLAPDHRCIAPDNLGFGLSDKPSDWSYLPREQGENLARLIEALQLKDITLVVHDFGGPIGLSYALQNPDNVRRLVLLNTWMWSLKGDPQYERVSRIMGSPVGRFLYQRMAFSPRVMMPMAMGDKSRLTKKIHAQYLGALATPTDRRATWVYARELLASSDWYDALWQQREKLRDKPALLLWGMKDFAFGAPALARWQKLFTNAKIVPFPDAGHFVQEEKAAELTPIVRDFIE